MAKKKNPKLFPVPTAYEEGQKIVDSKDLAKIEDSIDGLEINRRKKDEEAILKLINEHGKTETPLVKKITIEQATYQEALNNLLSLRTPETFEAMMLLYEYMESNKAFKIDKLTGTELLKLGGYKGIRQIHRHRILRRIETHLGAKLKVLDPEESIKNYKNKKKDDGLVYKVYDLVKIEKVVYSKKNPKLIKALMGIEFLPDYIKHLQSISRRYIPLEAIRKIEKDSSTDKTRHFIYKLSFKSAGIKSPEFDLTLEECENLGKFLNRLERDKKRRWRPIEKALQKAQHYKLFQFKWIFREPTKHEIEEDKISTDLFGHINENNIYETNGSLKDEFYKYIKKVTITRTYNLNSPQIELPFEIENEEPEKEQQQLTSEF